MQNASKCLTWCVSVCEFNDAVDRGLIMDMWHQVPNDIVVVGLPKCGVPNALDVTEDSSLWDNSDGGRNGDKEYV